MPPFQGTRCGLDSIVDRFNCYFHFAERFEKFAYRYIWPGVVNMSSSVESFYNQNFDGPTRILRSIYPQFCKALSRLRRVIFHSCSKRKPTFLIKLSFQSDLQFPTTAYFNQSREHEPVWSANLQEIAWILGDRYGLHKQKCLQNSNIYQRTKKHYQTL